MKFLIVFSELRIFPLYETLCGISYYVFTIKGKSNLKVAFSLVLNWGDDAIDSLVSFIQSNWWFTLVQRHVGIKIYSQFPAGRDEIVWDTGLNGQWLFKLWSCMRVSAITTHHTHCLPPHLPLTLHKSLMSNANERTEFLRS